jgi:hypothetical protein
MELEKTAYLNPASLSEEEAKRIFAPNLTEDARELALAQAALESIRFDFVKDRTGYGNTGSGQQGLRSPGCS